MAKIVNETGKYVSRQAVDQRRKILGGVLAFTACLFSVLGVVVGVALKRSPLWTHAVSFLGFALLLRVVFLWSRRKIEGLEEERVDPWKEAQRQSVVGMALGKLPDDFRVINGLSTALGPVDHVVVGPTGLFVLDEKNWKGVVSSDGNGELLWNGYPTDKPLVQEFGARVKGIRENLGPLSAGLKPFAQGLLVLTAASVESRLDPQGDVQCIRVEELQKYIVENKMGKRLRSEEVESVSKALLALVQAEASPTPREAPAE